MKPWGTLTWTRNSCEDLTFRTARSITKNRRDPPENPLWNSIKHEFEKKTCMRNPVKSLGYIKYNSSSSTRFNKCPANFIRHTLFKALLLYGKTLNYTENQKKCSIFQDDQQAPCENFFKDFANNGKKTYRELAFSHRPLSSIRKHRGQRTDFPIIWKTRFVPTSIERIT